MSNPQIMDGEIVQESTALVTQAPMGLEPLRPIMDLATAKERLRQFQEFVKFYLVENEDFGTIPGTPKPTLYKSGADKLCELYGLSDEYLEMAKTVDWDKGLFDYEFRCILKRGDRIVTSGMGCCSSFESRYRWRESSRKCPQCGKETIIKGRAEYGGGWLCFKKKGGCGYKFMDSDPSIVSQETGKVLNPDPADLKNTIMKMAKKRAKIDATLAATRSSGIFTQDIEDMESKEVTPAIAEPSTEDITAAFNPPEAEKPKAPLPTNGNHANSSIPERDKKALYALMYRNGRDHNDLKAFLHEQYGVDSTFTIPTYAYGDICLWAKGVNVIHAKEAKR
jgi:hypothetical protein